MLQLLTSKMLIVCRFKLCLADDDAESGATTLPNGFTPQKVISDYLRFLGDFALAKLCDQWGAGKITAKDVTWALTVPAAWSESSKQIMRQAAVVAGWVTHPMSRYNLAECCNEACVIQCMCHACRSNARWLAVCQADGMPSCLLLVLHLCRSSSLLVPSLLVKFKVVNSLMHTKHQILWVHLTACFEIFQVLDAAARARSGCNGQHQTPDAPCSVC